MPPPPSRRKEVPVVIATGVPELAPYKDFIEMKTDREELQRLFRSELDMGFVTIDDLMLRRATMKAAGRGTEEFEAAGIKSAIRERIRFEILQHIPMEGFKALLDTAVAQKNYEFDTGAYSAEFNTQIQDYKEDDIVFFVKRSTTVKLDVPCRNCGKKELFMEQPKQTARADEQIVKYARCANCQTRMNAQWLL